MHKVHKSRQNKIRLHAFYICYLTTLRSMTYGPLKRKPTYYMQAPFQILKAAPLLCTSFLHSLPGPIINSKTLLLKPDIAPLTYPNLLHLCVSSFPYSNSTFLHFSPSNVITLCRLKKSDFFFDTAMLLPQTMPI